jgi:hypothetical protein
MPKVIAHLSVAAGILVAISGNVDAKIKKSVRVR